MKFFKVLLLSLFIFNVSAMDYHPIDTVGSKTITAQIWWYYIRGGHIANQQSIFKQATTTNRQKLASRFIFKADSKGITLLDIAVKKLDLEMVKTIIENMKRDFKSAASLQFAIQNVNNNIQVTNFFLEDEKRVISCIRFNLESLRLLILIRLLLTDFIQCAKNK